MKVCLATTVHSLFDTRIFHKEAQTLAQEGYDVTLIAQHDENTIVNGVKVIGLPKPRNRLGRIFGLTWRAFRIALRQRATIYHLHDPELLPVGILLKLFTRAKVIYDVHEDVPKQILTKYWIPAPLRRPLAMVFGILEKLFSQRMDAVIAATEGIAEQFQQSNITVIHNYPNYKLMPESLPKKNNLLVYIGGLSKLRGVFEMIQALEYLDPSLNVCLKIIGKFESDELRKEVQNLPGYQRVCFLQWLPFDKAWKEAQEAIVGLVLFHPAPNHEKCLPNKLFEYMAAGLPVVASNFPLWKEIIEGNHCGLTVNPLDPKAIAQAVEYLITHPEEARRMGENGRRAVEKKYNWEQESKKLLSLYECLLKQ